MTIWLCRDYTRQSFFLFVELCNKPLSDIITNAVFLSIKRNIAKNRLTVCLRCLENVSDFLLSGVVSSMDEPGGNITGVSSMGPIDQQMDLVEQITPYPASVAIISSGTEVGSKFEVNLATQILDEKGISWKAFHAATEEDLRERMEEAARDYACIYLPTDNFVASHMDIVRDVVLETGVLTVTGDYQMCADGGLCCCSRMPFWNRMRRFPECRCRKRRKRSSFTTLR